jgi:hypothetical protein
MFEERDNAKFRYTREMLRDYVLILANSGLRVGEANNLKQTVRTAMQKFATEVAR